jgi:hypothetical protein
VSVAVETGGGIAVTTGDGNTGRFTNSHVVLVLAP